MIMIPRGSLCFMASQGSTMLNHVQSIMRPRTCRRCRCPGKQGRLQVMTLEVGLWRADGSTLTRLEPSGLALERQLEDYIEADPLLLGERLLLIGRQVPTAHGGWIDLLAVDADGDVHVIELKRDRTPRDVAAQTLDYGSWVARLGRTEVVDIFESYRSGTSFDQVFSEFFGDTPPEELNARQVFTIVAASVDPATERIVKFLNETFGVPINVVFFSHFLDDGASYLARTWLVDHVAEESPAGSKKSSSTREPWNGRDWYVSFGVGSGSRAWKDARQYGFVSAGGGEWYSRSLKNLPIGARVFVCIPKQGYVGVGKVMGEAVRFSEAVVLADGTEQKLSGIPLEGTYHYDPSGDSETMAEYVVPVEWEATVSAEDAIWKTGMFANQNSACKLSRQFTIDTVLTGLKISIDA